MYEFFHYCPLVKTRKEAKRMALMDSIAARRARLEGLKRTVQEQRTKRDEYASILSKQSLGTFDRLYNCLFFAFWLTWFSIPNFLLSCCLGKVFQI